jgi:hypothetical protein
MKKYNVYFILRKNHVLEVEAKDEEEAENIAWKRWENDDEGTFLDLNSETDGVEEIK